VLSCLRSPDKTTTALGGPSLTRVIAELAKMCYIEPSATINPGMVDKVINNVAKLIVNGLLQTSKQRQDRAYPAATDRGMESIE
jgi:hypothetical protein